MEGQTGDNVRSWLLVVAAPPPWQPLLGEVARKTEMPLLEVEDAVRAGDALRRATPTAALVFVDARVRDYAVSAALKSLRPAMPVVVLLRGGRDRALLNAMEMGGDDVLRLPVTAAELAERLEATVRRLQVEEATAVRRDDEPVQVGGLVVDVAARRARRGDRPLPLTDTEFQLLAMLAGSVGMPFSRERLLNQLCAFQYDIDSRVIDVHIRNLRRKIEVDPSRPSVIRAVPGVGYCVPQASD
ncbi:MAG: response regulator transcription factor [Streptomyces sp.]|jgi:DNA-binding response OmpR family regulator|nr:response regulator transcription factor [Streptomyces sp.]